MVGCRNKSELRKLDKFLKQFWIIKLSEVIADKSVELLRSYRLSHGLLIADSLIAATALTLNVAFVSKNQRDYRFISGLNLLAYPSLDGDFFFTGHVSLTPAADTLFSRLVLDDPTRKPNRSPPLHLHRPTDVFLGWTTNCTARCVPQERAGLLLCPESRGHW